MLWRREQRGTGPRDSPARIPPTKQKQKSQARLVKPTFSKHPLVSSDIPCTFYSAIPMSSYFIGILAPGVHSGAWGYSVAVSIQLRSTAFEALSGVAVIGSLLDSVTATTNTII